MSDTLKEGAERLKARQDMIEAAERRVLWAARVVSGATDIPASATLETHNDYGSRRNPEPTPLPSRKPLTFSDAVMQLTAVGNARPDLADTIDLLTVVIDADLERPGSIVVTFERHIKSDLAALPRTMKSWTCFAPSSRSKSREMTNERAPP